MSPGSWGLSPFCTVVEVSSAVFESLQAGKINNMPVTTAAMIRFLMSITLR
jgi:hypothetical protein